MSSVQVTLGKEFQDIFGITEVVRDFDGGQKKVFVIKIGEDVRVLKLFKDFGRRDIRELEIYEKYKDKEFLPKIIDVVEHNNDTVVFEKFIDGKTLEECKDDYLGNHELIIQLIKDIVSVLEELWLDGIIHRDIKPSNIIIVGGKPHIIDFGIAGKVNGTAFTDVGFQPCTYKFASPEQSLGKKELVTYRSDFFSIGVLAYYLYYGVLPFGDNAENIKGMFSSGNMQYKTDDTCVLNTLFEKLFNIKPHLRPRNTALLIDLLP